MRRFVELIFVSASLITVNAVCGGIATDIPDTGAVHGEITFDGQPLAEIRAFFKPHSGCELIAAVDETGAFSPFRISS